TLFHRLGNALGHGTELFDATGNGSAMAPQELGKSLGLGRDRGGRLNDRSPGALYLVRCSIVDLGEGPRRLARRGFVGRALFRGVGRTRRAVFGRAAFARRNELLL